MTDGDSKDDCGQPSSKFDCVEYLRAFASLYVLLHHVGKKLDIDSAFMRGLLECGALGVDVFFVISGFVILNSVHRNELRCTGPLQFLLSRAYRIMPLYWSLTTLALCVYLVKPSLVNSSGGSTNIFASYFLFPTDDKYLIQNGWTLFYEFYFYALLSLALLIRSPNRWLWVAVSLTVLALIGLGLQPESEILRHLLNPIIFEFAAGMGIFALYRRNVTLSAVSVAVMIAIFFACLSLESLGVITAFRVVNFGLPAMTLVAAVTLGSVHVGPLRPPLRWLARISFSLYLIHPFTIAAVSLTARGMIVRPYSNLALALAMFALSLLVAWGCFSTVEQFFLARKNKFERHGLLSARG